MIRFIFFSFLLLTMACSAKKSAPLSVIEQQQAFELFDRHLMAIGGGESLQRQESYSISGTIRELGSSQTHEYQLHQQSPNLYYIRINIRGKGVFERGYNGSVFWERGPNSSRVLTPEEKQNLLPSIDFYADVNYRQWYPVITTRTEAEFAGQPCDLLEVLNHKGEQEQVFFSKETGLKMGIVRFAGTDEETIVRYGHYISYDGIKMASSIEEKRGEIHRVWMIESVQWNAADLDFSPPPSLLDNK